MDRKPILITKTTTAVVELSPNDVLEGLNGNAPFDRLAALMPSVKEITEGEIREIHESFPEAIPGLIRQLTIQLERYTRIAGDQESPLIRVKQEFEERRRSAKLAKERSLSSRRSMHRLQIEAYDQIIRDLDTLIGEPKPKEEPDDQ